jgi:hypothetical protein
MHEHPFVESGKALLDMQEMHFSGCEQVAHSE